jgi:hypothetical protein
MQPALSIVEVASGELKAAVPAGSSASLRSWFC